MENIALKSITDLIGLITGNWQAIVGGITMVIGGFAVLARFTPNKSDDALMQKILSFINRFGMNSGKASNK